jgi:hypothetical protein
MDVVEWWICEEIFLNKSQVSNMPFLYKCILSWKDDTTYMGGRMGQGPIFPYSWYEHLHCKSKGAYS